jgi:hypothetical protein
MFTRLGLLVLGVICAAPAWAQEETRPIRFAPGTTATTLKGVIRGYGHDLYTVDVVQGQVMQVLLSASNRACSFNAFAPGVEDAVHNGSISGNEFGASPTVAGRYRFHIYLMRSAARRDARCRYSLSVEVTGPPGGVSAGVSDQVMADACRSRAAPMYGVAPAKIRLGAVRAGPRIDGTVDKGPEGLKKLRCLFTPERQLRDVMAMTPDGE